MALKGIKVIEIAGLAPAPFCGMVLSDFGARVIRVDKLQSSDQDVLCRGKQSISVDLKKDEGRDIIHKLCQSADVIIEPFRSGVMEKLGLGPDILMKENKRLVYARLTGYGQAGYLATSAGHDINYIATSGVLSAIGRKGDKPYAPINLLADFAGGGMVCALGIILALFERSKSGQGQLIDANMVEGSAYISKWLWATKDKKFLWEKDRGDNMLDGGAAFYDTYKTSDNRYMAVGAIEPQFFHLLIKGLGLNPDEVSQFGDQSQLKDTFTKIFASKTQAKWSKIFEKSDACCTPVLSKEEAELHSHNVENKTFLKDEDGFVEPGPAPRLFRTPGVNSLMPRIRAGLHTREILKDIGYHDNSIDQFIKQNIVAQTTASKL